MAEIDINTLRGISTLLVMVAFLGVCAWAYSSKRKKSFSDAAQIPFADDHLDNPVVSQSNQTDDLVQTKGGSSE